MPNHRGSQIKLNYLIFNIKIYWLRFIDSWNVFSLATSLDFAGSLWDIWNQEYGDVIQKISKKYPYLPQRRDYSLDPPPPPPHLSGNSNHVSYINLRFYVTLLCYVVLCYVMLCYVMLCYEMKWNEMKWNEMKWNEMICYVMLCYVMLCNVSNVM